MTACHPIRHHCHGPSLTYRWNMFRKEGNHNHPEWKYQADLKTLLSTKVESKHLVLKTIAPGFSYRLTAAVLSPDGARGWAAYDFESSAAPSGGTCRVKQLEKQTLGTSLNISCQGWTDKSKPLMYEFYRKSEDGTFDMMSYGLLPHSVVTILPEASEVHIKVVIINVLETASEIFLQTQVRTHWEHIMM